MELKLVDNNTDPKFLLQNSEEVNGNDMGVTLLEDGIQTSVNDNGSDIKLDYDDDLIFEDDVGPSITEQEPIEKVTELNPQPCCSKSQDDEAVLANNLFIQRMMEKFFQEKMKNMQMERGKGKEDGRVSLDREVNVKDITQEQPSREHPEKTKRKQKGNCDKIR